MDTLLGRLDPAHRSNVLKYLPKMADQVVLLVHEGEIDPERDIQHFADRSVPAIKLNVSRRLSPTLRRASRMYEPKRIGLTAATSAQLDELLEHLNSEQGGEGTKLVGFDLYRLAVALGLNKAEPPPPLPEKSTASLWHG